MKPLREPRLDLLEVSGSNFEMGYKHGSAFRKKVELIAGNMLVEAVSRTRMSKDRIFLMASKYLPSLESHAPHLIEEIRGIAEGSGLPFEQVLLLNLRHEFMYGIRTRQFQNDGCTIIGVARERSATGNVMLAQNVDLPPSFMGQMALFKLRPKTNPEILMYALAGTVGHHGMNSYGLARCSSALATEHEKAMGVSRVVLSRLILEHRSVGDAIETITKADRAVSGNYMLADSDDNLVDIETTATEYRALYPEDGFIAHSNHLIHPEMMDFDEGVCDDSGGRYRQMVRLISEHDGKVDSEDIYAWLRDHTGYPGSICNHTANSSVASLIFHPGERRMMACGGAPCENEYAEFRL